LSWPKAFGEKRNVNFGKPVRKPPLSAFIGEKVKTCSVERKEVFRYERSWPDFIRSDEESAGIKQLLANG
jgi:hypothetical protein